jgi:hypothetical protein
MASHLRSRSIGNRLIPPSLSSSSSSSLPSLSTASSSSPPLSQIALSARRLKALLQLILAVTILASLLLYLANSSPTGFSNSATAPAAQAVADVFIKYKPKVMGGGVKTNASREEELRREEERVLEEKARKEAEELVFRKMGGSTALEDGEADDSASSNGAATDYAHLEAEQDALDRSRLLQPLPRAEKLSKSSPWTLAKTAEGETLPKCEKIMLFTFMPWWGFASEYILYVRSLPPPCPPSSFR